MEEQIQHQDNMSHSHLVHPATPETSNVNKFSMMPVYPMSVDSEVISFPSRNPMENLTLGPGNPELKDPIKLDRPKTVVPNPKASNVSNLASSSSSAFDPPILSLGLSLSSDHNRNTSSRHSGLHEMPCFNKGDSIISVAWGT